MDERERQEILNRTEPMVDPSIIQPRKEFVAEIEEIKARAAQAFAEKERERAEQERLEREEAEKRAREKREAEERAAREAEEAKRKAERAARMKKAGRTALICVIIAAVCAAGGFLAYRFIPRTVALTTDDSVSPLVTEYKTQSRTVGDFLEENDIAYDAEMDIINVSLDDKITSNMDITIKKPVTVSVTADGATTDKTSKQFTVGEFLEFAELGADDDDIVEPARDHVLAEGDKVTLVRVEKKQETEDKVTKNFGKVYQADSNMTIGKVEVTQEGKNQISTKTYDVEYRDGKEVSRELVSEEQTQEVQDQITGYGTKIDFNNVPSDLKYSRSFQVRAVSYYFPGTPRGASGGLCTYGTCAVDPRVIPMGTKIFVQGYGYAVANDTGGAIKGNTIDLYMEDSRQCRLWGSRNVTVYIVSE